ncbi:AraC family transcriptional regulator [Vibrio vulnificus]|uniref:helix-turn-helix domain-containing protein n=1 Tax=Vibrio TaxID=662 RepID=UPI001023B94E|nr:MULTISPECIES: AraC family transcriptional regulator [Vibrio]EGR3030506.1 AraC family transcriptional regulator [Vibrio parahaemolyticus]EGQ7997620.1 AraC family transcriptional regulator [Vibrio vulnificus]EGR0129347.1 helix-turn-helix domain-containing protein [Vibrio vulnificus]EGR0753250.1 AraC family transcriptional regulator [Vibrio vulnificus]EJE4163884.1 helix-turn-helix domain-containing protein [Vibrio parahaemolyticus]
MKATAETITRRERSFTAYQFESAEFEHPYHFHHETELVFITKGHGKVLVGNSTANFCEGDIFLIGADVPHRFTSYSANAKHPLCSYVLQFTPDCFGSLFVDTPELSRIAQMISDSRHGLVIRSAPTYLFESIKNLIESQGVSSVIQFLSLLSEISKLGQCEYLANHTDTQIEVQPSTKISASIDWMQNNYHREFDLEAIATRTSMNKNAFCRAFKNHTGQSPMSYITQIRSEAAAKLLLETKLGVADIGFRVGFSTVSSFNRNFRQYHGTSPSAYRKMTAIFAD